MNLDDLRSSYVTKYVSCGFSLARLEPNSKKPVQKGWNTKAGIVKDPSSYKSGEGVAILHAFSGTACLDIDDLSSSCDFFNKHHLNLDDIINDPLNVKILSGVDNHLKILFKVPGGFMLPTRKLTDGGRTLFEFRSATSDGNSVADVLPPSIHPVSGRPYEWIGDFNNLSTIPENLLLLWLSLCSTNEGPGNGVAHSRSSEYNIDEIKEALIYISPESNREDWVRVGMALHHHNPDSETFEIWNNWSKGSLNKYKGREDLLTQWKSFSPSKSNPVTIKTLYALAVEGGWMGPNKKDPSTLLSPSDLLKSMRSGPPNISSNSLPTLIDFYSKEVSEIVGCDVVIPIFSMLSVISAVANASSRLVVKNGFEVPPIIWVMLIGPPGSKKTPGSSPIFKLLDKLQREEDPSIYNADMLRWMAEEGKINKLKERYLKEFADGGTQIDPAQIPILRKKPVPTRYEVGDITSQKLVAECYNRPRGLLCKLDETAGWFKRVLSTTGTEDRSTWVASYEANPYKMDRLGGGTTEVDCLGLSIFACVQPTLLDSKVEALTSDGLFQRFVTVNVRSVYDPPKDGLVLSEPFFYEKIKDISKSSIEKYRLCKDGSLVFQNFVEWSLNVLKEWDESGFNVNVQGVISKLQGTAARLIFLFHLIESPFKELVSKECVEMGINFSKTYILPSVKYTFDNMKSISALQNWLVDYILAHSHKERVLLSEIKRDFKGSKVEDIRPAVMEQMIYLEEANWVSLESKSNDPSNAKTSWRINPILGDLFESEREEVLLRKRKLREVFSSKDSDS